MIVSGYSLNVAAFTTALLESATRAQADCQGSDSPPRPEQRSESSRPSPPVHIQQHLVFIPLPIVHPASKLHRSSGQVADIIIIEFFRLADKVDIHPFLIHQVPIGCNHVVSLEPGLIGGSGENVVLVRRGHDHLGQSETLGEKV